MLKIILKNTNGPLLAMIYSTKFPKGYIHSSSTHVIPDFLFTFIILSSHYITYAFSYFTTLSAKLIGHISTSLSEIYLSTAFRYYFCH